MDEEKLKKFIDIKDIDGKEVLEKADTQVLDFSNPDYTFTPKETHTWRQRGYYVVCRTCDAEHGVWIGKNNILVGINDKGEPLLKTRTQLNMA